MSNETPKLRRYTPLGKPRLTSGHGDTFEPRQNVDYLYLATDVDSLIEQLQDILAEVTNELQYMYASYHSHVRERDRRADEELIQRARELLPEQPEDQASGTEAAPEVCEWRPEGNSAMRIGCNQDIEKRWVAFEHHYCPQCSRPIRIVEGDNG